MKTKFFFSSLLFFGALLFPLAGLHAGLFPNDSKTTYLDVHSGTSGEFMPGANYIRTILYINIQCNNTGDYRLVLGSDTSQPNQNNLSSTEQTQNYLAFSMRLWPANTPIYWAKPVSTDKCNFRIIYTDYDLSLVPTNEITINYASSTPAIGRISTSTMTSNIENIGYMSTTTTISGGQTFTEGVYNIPFILFEFMTILFFAILLIVFLSIYFLNKKNAD